MSDRIADMIANVIHDITEGVTKSIVDEGGPFATILGEHRELIRQDVAHMTARMVVKEISELLVANGFDAAVHADMQLEADLERDPNIEEQRGDKTVGSPLFAAPGVPAPNGGHWRGKEVPEGYACVSRYPATSSGRPEQVRIRLSRKVMLLANPQGHGRAVVYWQDDCGLVVVPFAVSPPANLGATSAVYALQNIYGVGRIEGSELINFVPRDMPELCTVHPVMAGGGMLLEGVKA